MSDVILEQAKYRFVAGHSVGPIDLQIRSGQLVLFAGRSGCGKSTLLRMISGALHRTGAGQMSGQVWIDGTPAGDGTVAERLARYGLVPQELLPIRLGPTVADELAFPLESAATPPLQIEQAVRVAASQLPFSETQDPQQLSGGERQQLAITCARMAGANLLLLDEPFAHLDQRAAAQQVLELVQRRSQGCTILLAEHRLKPLLPIVDRVVVLDGGRIVFDGPPSMGEVICRQYGLILESSQNVSLSRAPGRPLLQLPAVQVVGRVTMPELTLHAGDRIAVLGENGAGKSTWFGELIEKHRQQIAWVPQDPDRLLLAATVRKELGLALKESGLENFSEEVERLASIFGLSNVLDRPPHGLSKGQRVRVAVGAVLSTKRSVLLLDEPTAGLDAFHAEQLLSVVAPYLGEEGVLVFATHDVDLAYRWANRILHLEAGVLVRDQRR